MKRLLLAALWLAVGAPAAAAGDDPHTLPTLQAQADALVSRGFDRPDAALAALATLARHTPPHGARVLQLARGLVAAGAGRAADAESAVHALGLRPEALAAADAQLVRATLAATAGRGADAASAAADALRHYQVLCPADPGCDWRSSYLARQTLARQEASAGRSHAAREHVLAAAELARAGGDAPREVWALAAAADHSRALGDGTAEKRDVARAQRLARLADTPQALVRLAIAETRVHQRSGDLQAARDAAESGLEQAARAQSPRLAAVLLANLADIHVKAGRPQAALQAVEHALPIVRRHGDRRIEQVLLHNAALARIALGRHADAQRTLEELLAAHDKSGARGDQAETLREFADAWAAAGHHAAALALYHRERQLAAEIMAANRDAALAELHTRFDREAQQRRLHDLARESALMTQQLDNRRAQQRLWLAGAVALLLGAMLVALLYRRARHVNRALARNQAVLRTQSEQDTLTGLANRRALHARARLLGLDVQFAGALLLVDIDHFKHVNDAHGHAGGDRVLQAVAARLTEAAGTHDLVVRWGGEEFLVFMPGATLAGAQALAARLLAVIGSTPVALPEGPLRVTASIGWAAFPLPPAHLALSLERAINFADMALYTAKNQGRNRAVGIGSALAADAAALAAVEADFDSAWHDGRVTLLREAGPAAAAAAPADATAAPVM